MGYYLDFYGPAIYDFVFTHIWETAHILVEAVREHLKPGVKVLDAGTGTGFVAYQVAPLIGDGHLIGVDAEEDALLLARYKASKREVSNVTFQKGDALHLEFEDNSFDVALANQVPATFPDVFKEMISALRPGGIVDVARPHSSESRSFLYDIACELAAQRSTSSPRWTGDRRFDLPAIRGLFEQMGLEPVKLEQVAIRGIRSSEMFLLNFIIQDRYLRMLVSHALQVDQDDRASMITGCLDFLQVGKRILDEEYGGEFGGGCIIAVGKKTG